MTDDEQQVQVQVHDHDDLPVDRLHHANKTWIDSFKILVLLSLLGLQLMAVKITALPLNRFIESRYCQEYYRRHDASMIHPDGSIPESLCKLDSIQQRLAWMQGALDILHSFCDILVTIPLGLLSDLGYRRLVLTLNLCGLSLMLLWIVTVGYFENVIPVKALILGPLFSLLGGADCVFMSNVATMVTEIAPESTQRATYFAYVSSIVYVTGLISPSIAAFTMSNNLWLPFWIGISLLLLATPLVFLLPASDNTHHNISSEIDPLLRREPAGSKVAFATRTSKSFSRLLERTFQVCSETWSRAVRRSNFKLLVAVFAIASLASCNSSFLPQYISKRYGWKLAQTGYLLSVKAAVNITLLTVIVPLAIRIMSKKIEMDGLRINMYGAKLSLLFSVIGALLVAISPTVWILFFSLIVYAIGSALPVFAMSLVKSPSISREMREDDETREGEGSTQDYGLVMLARSIGALIGLPIMTVAWAEGIGQGGAALGLPYFLSAISYLLGYLVIRRIRLGVGGSDEVG